MNPDTTLTPVPPRWLHALAVLTVLFTLPLLFLGAGVTSHDVGMVDPRGFRLPWDIINGLFENTGLGWRLEYGHRTFGFLVGLCGIGLAVGCWFFDRRPWLGGLGFLALVMICAQGALGIFRVDYNALHGRTFALIHGCFAQLVFATLVSVALMTSRRWATDRIEPVSPALQRWSIITALLVFVELILGGLVRHQESLFGPRGHLLGAFAVVAAVVWLLKQIAVERNLFRSSVEANGINSVLRNNTFPILLMLLLAAQLLLGIESWLAKFFAPRADFPQLLPLPMHTEWIRTAHYLVGSMIFATVVAVALVANRKPVLALAPAPVRARELEGAL
jgi:heme a synthase